MLRCLMLSEIHLKSVQNFILENDKPGINENFDQTES